MRLADEDLWCDINGRTAVGRRLAVSLQHFREAKIDELDVPTAISRQHDVLGLQISVDNLLSVQVLQGQNRLGSVEIAVALNRRVLLDYLTQERAALNVFQLKVQIALVLERREEAHDERAVTEGVGHNRGD